MKNTLLLLTAIGVAMSSSCTKKKCWTCTLTTTYSISSVFAATADSITQSTECDKTESEIRKFEKQNSASSRESGPGQSGNGTAPVKTVMKCN